MLSIIPPKYPEIPPSITPIKKLIKTPTKPTQSEILEAKIVCENRSNPSLLVPNKFIVPVLKPKSFLESGIIMARIDAEWFRAGLGSLIIISVIFNTYISRRATQIGQNKAKD